MDSIPPLRSASFGMAYSGTNRPGADAATVVTEAETPFTHPRESNRHHSPGALAALAQVLSAGYGLRQAFQFLFQGSRPDNLPGIQCR
jgi:hypothetical protein